LGKEAGELTVKGERVGLTGRALLPILLWLLLLLLLHHHHPQGRRDDGSPRICLGQHRERALG
jgi:hypothetical protein